MRKAIIMPKIGLDMEEGTISQWKKAVGDRVEEGEIICDIETDKTITNLESTVNGTLVEIVAQEGDEVEITKTIAWVEVDE
ncbi:MAG: biotin attachment protein [Lachnospiraceae bacterium]|nr:biotin attachment protein [Lachnospiraceae bacterium]